MFRLGDPFFQRQQSTTPSFLGAKGEQIFFQDTYAEKGHKFANEKAILAIIRQADSR